MVEVKTKAPGKLYVAGEYAVVEPGYSAIITAVDLFIHLSILEQKKGFGTIYSEGFTDAPVKWKRVQSCVQLEHSGKSLKYILAALHTTENYLAELGYELKTYDMQFTSELDHELGHKLGLGSSGAVTVATVQALLQLYEVDASDLLVYKLSVLAQLQLGINSSFGDLAAITYTGWIQYTSFDRKAVFEHFNLYSTVETIAMEWPALEIKQLDVSDKINFLIGWTGTPASSDHLVGAVQEKKAQSVSQYADFLNDSKLAVDDLADALATENYKGIAEAIQKNRAALIKMGAQTNVVIETPQLQKLCEIALKYGGAAKTSGAGGGDSGIAFVFDDANTEHIITEWQGAQITNLPLTVYSKPTNI